MSVSRKQLAAIKEFKKRELPKPKTDVENTTIDYLHPKRGALDADGKEVVISSRARDRPANIMDEEFLERYRRREVLLHHTDIPTLRMKQNQKVRNGRILTTYDILEVLDYTQGQRNERLPGLTSEYPTKGSRRKRQPPFL